jgi:hypothetical protein
MATIDQYPIQFAAATGSGIPRRRRSRSDSAKPEGANVLVMRKCSHG